MSAGSSGDPVPVSNSCEYQTKDGKPCFVYRGVTLARNTPPRSMRALEEFQVRPDDLYIVTWPKSGTTWVSQLMVLVQSEGDVTVLEGESLMRTVHFLDVVMDGNNPETAPMVIERADAVKSSRILKSHCLPEWLPKGIQTDNPEAKVIYVARNPKDAAVSHYHFCHYAPFHPFYNTWDEFFEDFLIDKAPYGSWFKSVLPWWRRRNHSNVLFLKYEDIHKDVYGTIKQIAEFMEKSLTADVVKKIAVASTFDSMRQTPFANLDYILHGKLQEPERSFMRKGVVGDWKNYFTEEQNKRFDELYYKELAGTGLKFDFELINGAALRGQ